MSAAAADASTERQNLLVHLLDAVKQSQVRFGGRRELATEGDSRVSCLCAAWEAALSHGMRHTNKALSTLKQMTEITGLSKVASNIGLIENIQNMETEPVFWQYVKEHLSKHEVQRYMLLRHVTTDAGRGRAWLRSTLNEHSLEKYMHMVLEDAQMIKTFYDESAFLRDQERASMLPMMAAGLSSILFAINIDNPDLNAIRPAAGLDAILSSTPPSRALAPPVDEEPRPVIHSELSPKNERRKERKKKKKIAHIVSFDEDDGTSSYCSTSPGSSVTSPLVKSFGLDLGALPPLVTDYSSGRGAGAWGGPRSAAWGGPSSVSPLVAVSSSAASVTSNHWAPLESSVAPPSATSSNHWAPLESSVAPPSATSSNHWAQLESSVAPPSATSSNHWAPLESSVAPPSATSSNHWASLESSVAPAWATSNHVAPPPSATSSKHVAPLGNSVAPPSAKNDTVPVVESAAPRMGITVAPLANTVTSLTNAASSLTATSVPMANTNAIAALAGIVKPVANSPVPMASSDTVALVTPVASAVGSIGNKTVAPVVSSTVVKQSTYQNGHTLSTSSEGAAVSSISVSNRAKSNPNSKAALGELRCPSLMNGSMADDWEKRDLGSGEKTMNEGDGSKGTAAGMVAARFAGDADGASNVMRYSPAVCSVEGTGFVMKHGNMTNGEVGVGREVLLEWNQGAEEQSCTSVLCDKSIYASSLISGDGHSVLAKGVGNVLEGEVDFDRRGEKQHAVWGGVVATTGPSELVTVDKQHKGSSGALATGPSEIVSVDKQHKVRSGVFATGLSELATVDKQHKGTSGAFATGSSEIVTVDKQHRVTSEALATRTTEIDISHTDTWACINDVLPKTDSNLSYHSSPSRSPQRGQLSGSPYHQASPRPESIRGLDISRCDSSDSVPGSVSDSVRTTDSLRQRFSHWDSTDSADIRSLTSNSSLGETGPSPTLPQLSSNLVGSHVFGAASLTPVSPDGRPLEGEMMMPLPLTTASSEDSHSCDSVEIPSYTEDVENAAYALAVTQQGFLASTDLQKLGATSPEDVSSESLTPGELKQALVAMMLQKDELMELRATLEAALEGEREVTRTLRAEVGALQRGSAQLEERDAERVKALSKENELLKHQLRKYVNAVQLLRTQGAKTEDIPGIHLEDLQPTIPAPRAHIDYSHEASEYEKKLIQVAEMHGELMEFNEVLHRQLNVKDHTILRLKQELTDLRGPLPEDFQMSDDSISVTSEVDMAAFNRPLVNIWIPSAFLRGAGSDAFHVYQVYVRIRDEEWNIYRRYAEFHELHSKLRKKYPIVHTYEFPSKKTFGNRDPKFVEERRRKLQVYLRQVINLFLQTNPDFVANVSRTRLLQVAPFFGDVPNAEKKKNKRKAPRGASGGRGAVPTASPAPQQHYMGL